MMGERERCRQQVAETIIKKYRYIQQEISSGREDRIDRKLIIKDLDKKINQRRVWNYRLAITGRNNEPEEGTMIKAIWA